MAKKRYTYVFFVIFRYTEYSTRGKGFLAASLIGQRSIVPIAGWKGQGIPGQGIPMFGFKRTYTRLN